MSDYGPIGDAVAGLEKMAIAVVCIAVPLALWKLVDIVMWICKHVTVGVTP